MIYEVSTLSARGQVTIPKPIRQVLGVDAGARLAFEVLGDQRVVVTAAARVEAGEVDADDESYDPAIGPFLGLLDKDIDAGRVGPMPPDLEASMMYFLHHPDLPPVDLNEEIVGEVHLG